MGFSLEVKLPLKMEQIECSETSAYINQTPGHHPKENKQHSEQGESLKSRILSVKVTEIPLQARTGPDVSRRLRLPDFKTNST